MLQSYPHASADILFNIKLLLCQQSALVGLPHLQELGRQKRQLCAGAASQPEGARTHLP